MLQLCLAESAPTGVLDSMQCAGTAVLVDGDSSLLAPSPCCFRCDTSVARLYSSPLIGLTGLVAFSLA